jgi:hypothetical protein
VFHVRDYLDLVQLPTRGRWVRVMPWGMHPPTRAHHCLVAIEASSLCPVRLSVALTMSPVQRPAGGNQGVNLFSLTGQLNVRNMYTSDTYR